MTKLLTRAAKEKATGRQQKLDKVTKKQQVTHLEQLFKNKSSGSKALHREA